MLNNILLIDVIICCVFLQPFVNMNIQRRPKWLIPPEEV